MNLRDVSQAIGFPCRYKGQDASVCLIASEFSAPLPVGTPISLESDRGPILVKIAGNPTDQFVREAEGLSALSAVPMVSTPYVYHADAHFIAMQRFETLRWHPDASTQLGEALAAVHHHTSQQFGYPQDGWIGKNRQQNTPTDMWGDFFIQHRLVPQYVGVQPLVSTRTTSRFHKLCMKWQYNLNALRPPASLLHGDLWGGNALCTTAGPVLIDPAVYHGHAETDLAMTHLFGGFTQDFYDAYYANYPTEPDYNDRRDLYNLYHLLNHANLFGGSYVRQAIEVIDRYT